MDDAIKKVRQLAASALLRKEKLEGELKTLEAERARALDSEDALRLADVDRRIESTSIALDDADSTYREILTDLSAVQDAAKEHQRLSQRAPVDAALNPDMFSTSAEDAALDNVRQHIEELSARAELEEELGGQRKSDRELERNLAAIEKQEREEKAKAQLAALKAQKKPKSEPAASSDDEPPPPKKPKKTM